MGIENLFSGSELREVSADGEVVLPDFVRTVIERRSAARQLILGPHESDPCLSAYDESYGTLLYAEVERRRLRDEEKALPPGTHHARTRRLFGSVEHAAFDSEGRLRLPAMVRQRGGIGELALFVGTGGTIEIWNPEVARQAGDEALRELAEYRLQHRQENQEREG
jgi:MraZ protein